MGDQLKRIAEIRLIVTVLVDLADEQLKETLAKSGKTSSVAEVVSSEVVSNLESVSYIDAAVVSRL
jgi:hypothetical protein